MIYLGKISGLKEKFKEFVEMLKQTQRLVKFKGRETERSR